MKGLNKEDIRDIIIIALIFLTLFVLNTMNVFKMMGKQMKDEQFEMCKEQATAVFSEGFLQEESSFTSNGITIKNEGGVIKVDMSGYIDEITASINDGSILFQHKTNFALHIIISVLCGIYIAFIGTIAFILIINNLFYEKKPRVNIA